MANGRGRIIYSARWQCVLVMLCGYITKLMKAHRSTVAPRMRAITSEVSAASQLDADERRGQNVLGPASLKLHIALLERCMTQPISKSGLNVAF